MGDVNRPDVRFRRERVLPPQTRDDFTDGRETHVALVFAVLHAPRSHR